MGAGAVRLGVALGCSVGAAATSPQLYAPNQVIFFRDFLGRAGKHDRGERHGWANDGEVALNFGFQNSSDEKLKRAVEPAGPEELQQVFGQPEVHVGLRRPKRARGPTRGFNPGLKSRSPLCVLGARV